MVFASPAVVWGGSPWLWGQLLNAVAATATLLLTAWLARPLGPRTMLLAVAALVAWLSLFDLARTARLDVPEAALTLAYLAVASSAINTGLVRRGILAGVVFAWAFLVKESCLVLIGVPFISAVAERRPTAQIARAAGLVLLLVVPLVSWWFGWYAGATGKVYALGIAAGLLIPLAAVLVALGVALVALGSGWGPMARLRGRIDLMLSTRRRSLAVGGLLVVVWAMAFLFAFSRSGILIGRPLLDIPNLARWSRAWLPDVAPILMAGVGVVGAVVLVLRGDDRPMGLLATAVAGLPWLLLVAVLGEPPRNDIAIFAVVAVLGAAGWLVLPDALARRDGALLLAGAVVGAAVLMVAALQLSHHGVAPSLLKGARGLVAPGIVGAMGGAVATTRAGRTWLARRLAAAPFAAGRPIALRGAAVAVVAALSVGVLAGATPRMVAASSSNSSKDLLARQTAAWIDANATAGSTIMFGSVLANETATYLGGGFQLRSLKATIGIVDPGAPLGVRIGAAVVPDIVAMDRHPRENGFLVLTAAAVDHSLRVNRPAYWVYVTGIDTAAPSVVPWLSTVPGVSLVTTLDSPPGTGAPLVARVYRIDMPALAVPSDHSFVSAAAVNALLDGLGSDPRAAAIASALLARGTLTGDVASIATAMARLHAVAGH